MDAQSLRQELNKQPFREVAIKTSDGDTFRVQDPEYYLITPNEKAIFVFAPDSTYRVVALDHIVSVESVEKKSKNKGKR